MPFDVRVQPEARIVEVIYPPEPTQEEVDDYVRRLRAEVEALGPGEWKALVDQRSLKSLTPELVKAMSGLNAWAQANGMARSARMVSDPGAGLQAWRMTKQALLTIPTATFDNRKDALAWLKDPEA